MMKQVKHFALKSLDFSQSNFVFTLQELDGLTFIVSNNETPSPNEKEKINLAYGEDGEIEAVYLQGVKFLIERKDDKGSIQLYIQPQLLNIGLLPAIFRHRMQFFREFVPEFENWLYPKEYDGCEMAVAAYQKFFAEKEETILTEGSLLEIGKLTRGEDYKFLGGNPRDFALCMAMAMRQCTSELFEKSKKDVIGDIENSIILMMPLIGDFSNKQAQPRADLIRLYLETQIY